MTVYFLFNINFCIDSLVISRGNFHVQTACQLTMQILKGRWPPDVKRQLTGKDPSAGKDWGQEEKGAKEDEMAGWLHWLNGHEFEQTPRGGEGQESLACSSPWGHKESEMTQQLNWTERVERRQKELYLIPKSCNHFPHPYSPPTFDFPLPFYCFFQKYFSSEEIFLVPSKFWTWIRSSRKIFLEDLMN